MIALVGLALLAIGVGLILPKPWAFRPGSSSSVSDPPVDPHDLELYQRMFRQCTLILDKATTQGSNNPLVMLDAHNDILRLYQSIAITGHKEVEHLHTLFKRVQNDRDALVMTMLHERLAELDADATTLPDVKSSAYEVLIQMIDDLPFPHDDAIAMKDEIQKRQAGGGRPIPD